MGEDGPNLVDALLGDVELSKASECDVEDGAPFRCVDVLASEHLVAPFLYTRLTHEIEEFGEDWFGDQVLGEIDKEGG